MPEVDILLINPVLIQKRNISKPDFYTDLEKYPPLGLAYLASYCKNKGFKVAIIDLEVEHLSKKKLLQRIEELKPKIIGIECVSALVSVVLELAQTIKDKFDIPLVLGGPHANIGPDALLNNNFIDFVVRGEGEECMSQLLEYTVSKEIELKDIDNLSYKQDGKITHNKLAPLRMNLDEYPFPDRSLLKNELYFNPFTRGTKFTSLITSRGCVYNCVFCNPIFKKLRKRSVKNVIDEIKEEINIRGIHNFEIFDETFNFPPEWVIDFCDQVIKDNLKISFRIRCRPDLITSEEMTQKLKQAGCYLISLGIESASDKTLRFFRKTYTSEQVGNAIALIQKAGIEIHGYFILGSPPESKQEMMETIDFALKSNIDFATFAMLTPIPGTPLYTLANEKGWWKDKNKLDYSEQMGVMSPILEHPEMSKKELARLHKYAHLKFYLRLRTIPNLFNLLFHNPLFPLKVLRNRFQ